MPTTLPRIQVTVTPELQRALETAHGTLPSAPTGQLVAQLALRGAQALEDEREERSRQRREALLRFREEFAGVYPPGYLEELRKDWPE